MYVLQNVTLGCTFLLRFLVLIKARVLDKLSNSVFTKYVQGKAVDECQMIKSQTFVKLKTILKLILLKKKSFSTIFESHNTI